MRRDALEEKRKIKSEKRSKAAVKIYMLAMAVTVIFLTGALYIQYDKKIKSDFEIAELEEKLEAENKKTDELNRMLENMDSDEYIEKMARKQLGYVKPNEIIYVDKNK